MQSQKDLGRIVLRVPSEFKKAFRKKLDGQGRSATYVGSQLIKAWIDGAIVVGDESRKGRKHAG